MAGRRPYVPLHEVVEGILDRRGVTPLKLGSNFRSFGHRVISARLVKGGRIDLAADEPRFVDSETYHRWMKTPLLADDVILTSEAPLGEVAYVREDLDWCLGQRLFGIRTRKDRLHGRFLYYALQFEEVAQDLHSRASGTTVFGVRQAELRQVRVPVPPMPEQYAIAALLGALDDRVEVNRQINRTLEEMAAVLFERLVSPFDGEPTAGRTVQGLIDRRVLVVGDGYRAKNAELAAEGLPFARAGNIDAGFHFADAELLGWPAVARAGAKVSEPLDVVFTSKGTVGRFAFVASTTPKFAYSPQLCFWRSGDRDRLSPYFLYHWMTSRRFLEQVDAVKGQTDMADYVSLTDQRLMRIACPPPDAHRQLATEVGPLWDLHFSNTDETKTLTALRDALLPKLLTGEIRLKQAEQVVEAAL
jgi:type I restriction enzyme, S subunit